MRLLGVGLQGIRIFCGLMDLGRGLHKKAYYGIMKSIQISVNRVYNTLISKAVKEEKQLNSEAGYPENELSVFGDGSWSKRGISSLFGIVSLIGKHSNKILDTVVKSSVCKVCEFWKGKENTVDFEAWYVDHEEECQANRKGRASKMEVDGIVEIFQRSIEKHGVKYAFYIGDGDTKTFKSLLDIAPYGDEFIVKKKNACYT